VAEDVRRVGLGYVLVGFIVWGLLAAVIAGLVPSPVLEAAVFWATFICGPILSYLLIARYVEWSGRREARRILNRGSAARPRSGRGRTPTGTGPPQSIIGK
jgi:membrane protein implicated in regulation of membrane protease activity